MKKTVLFTLLIVAVLGTQAAAQSLTIGLRGGMNIANASTDATATASVRQGLLYGGFIELEVFPPFTFQVGVQFAEKGAKLTVLTPGLPKPNMDVTYQFNYLEFPINLKLAIGKPSFQVYGTAGITVGTLLKAVGEFGGGETKDLMATLDKTAYSFDLGGGLGFQIASHIQFLIDARYSMGLKNINTSGKDLLSVNSWKARDLHLMGGVSYRFGSGNSGFPTGSR